MIHAFRRRSTAVLLAVLLLVSCAGEVDTAATDAALEALISDLLARPDVLEAGANYDVSTSVALTGSISVFARGTSDDRGELLVLVREVAGATWDSRLPQIDDLSVTVAAANGGSTRYGTRDVFGADVVVRDALRAEFGPRNSG